MIRSDNKRPDGATDIPWKTGRCLVWDATVPDTLAASHVKACSQKAGAAAAKAETVKCLKYESLSTCNHFIPVAIETMGTYGKSAWNFIRDLGNRSSAASGDLLATAKLRQRISVAIQRGNAISVAGTFT